MTIPELNINKLEDFIVKLPPGHHNIIDVFRPKSYDVLIEAIKLLMDRRRFQDMHGFDVSFNTDYKILIKFE